MSLVTLGMNNVQTAQFGLTLSQQFRNPLDNINFSLELLEEALAEKDIDDAHPGCSDIKLYLDIIRRSSGSIRELVSEIPKYSVTLHEEDLTPAHININAEILAIAEEGISENRGEHCGF